MITGAQTEVPAVAISGPNAMLSRLSFDPPVTAELLNSKTFVSAFRSSNKNRHGTPRQANVLFSLWCFSLEHHSGPGYCAND
jgi:hypothetical protein